MRAITKLPEPAGLSQHRANTHADFDNLSPEAKQELRERLVEEQRGLCCYCCSRIEPEVGKMKIEHWQCQANHPEHQLDYRNLLGVCMGNEGKPGKMQHCDTRKGDQVLSRNPANQQHQIEEVIHYWTDGSIRSANAQLDAELGEDPQKVHQNSERVLNLNLPFLKNNRKAVLDAFKLGLNKRGPLQEITLQKLLAKSRGVGGGALDSYSPVIAFWLRRRLGQSSRP